MHLDSLVVYRTRVSEEKEEQVVTSYNGREIQPEEQELITQARAAARLQEASMLRGLTR